MSLVNKMLRDLDARRIGEGERAALPAAVTPLAAHLESGTGPWRATLLAALGAATLAGAAWYLLSARTADAPPVAVLATTPPRMPAVPAAPAPPAEAPPVVAAPAPPAQVPPPGPAVVESAPPPAPVSATAALRMASELSALPAPIPDAAPKPATPKTSTRAPVVSALPSQPVVVAPKAPPPLPEARISKQERVPSAADRAETDYQRGVAALRQGNADAANAAFRAALDAQPEHPAARQSLAALLIEARHFDDAEDLLRKGTELAPVRLASVLALARLKVERNQAPAALELLLKHAAVGERSAEFQGFSGALLNRAGRAAEAVERYQAASRLAPSEGRWWAGLGIALDGAGRATEAREAYQKARSLPGLPPDLAQHVEQRLR